MSVRPAVTRIGQGVYRVEHEGRTHTVYVAGTPGHEWAYWDGIVFQRPFPGDADARTHRRAGADAHQSLSAPMPGTVLKVLVEPGAAVRRGDTLIILEAMKMELPIRADSDATVTGVLCREGELVQPGSVLIELE